MFSKYERFLLRHRWILPGVMVLVLLGGGAYSGWTFQSERQHQRETLLTEAGMAATAVNWRRIEGLTGSEADLSSPDYARLKEQLTRMRLAQPACRFIYLMGQRTNGDVFFFVDSEPTGSRDYSPPGQVYAEASAGCRQVFATGVRAVDGPYTDRWGTWVSALVPVLDDATGERLAVLGMDVDAGLWRQGLIRRCSAPVAVTALLAILVATLLWGQRRMVAVHECLLASGSALRESEEWARAVLGTVQAGVVIMDAESREIVFINDAAVTMVGLPRERLVGSVCHRFICPAEQGQCPVADLGQAVDNSERVLLTAAGTRLPILKTARVLTLRGRRCIVDSFLDLSAYKQAERERLELLGHLDEKQRLESLGTLAGGVGHEINNPVTGIINYAELIRDPDSTAADVQTYAGEIIAEGRRIASIAQTLRRLASPEPGPRTQVKPADLVQSALQLVQGALSSEGIYVSVEVPVDLPMIQGNRPDLEQMLLALVSNAREALNQRFPEAGSSGKALSIAAHEVRVDGSAWVRVVVEDHGTGISPEVQARLFEPFFTTKGRVQGKGLSLATSRGIVAAHGGRLWVESQPGQWTRFHVDLPAAEASMVQDDDG